MCGICDERDRRFVQRCYCAPAALDPTRPTDGQVCNKCGVRWIERPVVKPTHYSDEVVGHAPHNGRVTPPITLRTFHDDARWDLFVGGWRVGIYKTEAGARRRAAREAA